MNRVVPISYRQGLPFPWLPSPQPLKEKKTSNFFNCGHLSFCFWHWALPLSFKCSGKSSCFLASMPPPWTWWNKWLWESKFLPGLGCQHGCKDVLPKGLLRDAWREPPALSVTWLTLDASFPILTLNRKPEMCQRKVLFSLSGKVVRMKGLRKRFVGLHLMPGTCWGQATNPTGAAGALPALFWCPKELNHHGSYKSGKAYIFRRLYFPFVFYNLDLRDYKKVPVTAGVFI